LIGIAYYSVKRHFGWNFTPKKDLIILVIIFAIFDNFDWPMLFYLDVTITIGNKEIADFLDLPPGSPIASIFDPGWFDFFMYLVQAVLASALIRTKLRKNTMSLYQPAAKGCWPLRVQHL